MYGRMPTVLFDDNCSDQTKECGWVERFMGTRTSVDVRSGERIAVSCFEGKGTDSEWQYLVLRVREQTASGSILF
jgi:hypothetical protein